MKFFDAIVNFVKGLFGQAKPVIEKAAPIAARIAGRYVALNNPEKVKAALPIAESVLASAKAGQIDRKQIDAALKDISIKVNNPDFDILLSAIEIPAVEIGTVNADLILIIEAFIQGCKAA